jgi:hypothetical protein
MLFKSVSCRWQSWHRNIVLTNSPDTHVQVKLVFEVFDMLKGMMFDIQFCFRVIRDN